MYEIFFTSDLHFGHHNAIRYDKRPFMSVEEMDYELICRWNRKVERRDIVYILGDVSWHPEDRTARILEQLNGRKRLIKGNHDRVGGKVKKCFEYVKDYEEVNVGEKTLVLSHYPIPFYNHHYKGAIMLYGHVHNSHEEVYTQDIVEKMTLDGVPCEMYNVGCMLWGYEPVTLGEIVGRNAKVNTLVKGIG